MTNQEIMEAYRLAYKQAAAPTIDQMRSAVHQAYGENNLKGLDDDAYVRRKFAAGMKGSRARDLQAALQSGGSMTAGVGAQYQPARNYGVFGRPQKQVPRPAQQPVQTAYRPTAPRQYNPAQQAMMAQRAQIEAIRQKQQRMSAAYQAQAGRTAYLRNASPQDRAGYLHREQVANRSARQWNAANRWTPGAPRQATLARPNNVAVR